MARRCFNSARFSARIAADKQEKWAGHSPFFFGAAGLPGPPQRGRGAGLTVDLTELLERTLPALGYELVELERSARGRLVRVFIDKPGGVDVEDCARVSNHLTRLFAAENVDFDRLEVSSPGLDRPLTKLADYARFAGEEAQLTLAAPVDGAKRVKGIVRGTEGDNVLVETAAGLRSFRFGTIGRARLVPRIDWRKGS
jgi:ribosome maturation factor RimP